MRSAAFIAALAGLAAAGYHPQPESTTDCTTTETPVPSVWTGKPSWTTETVTAITTYCPYATTIVHKGQTYTATEATTITITNCPCEVTKPVYTPAPSVVPVPVPAPVSPAPYTPAPANQSTPAPYSPPTQQTSSAGKLTAAGAAIMAVFGLVAAL